MFEFESSPNGSRVQSLLREGKTKRIWQTTDPDIVVIENTDRLTAYNGREEIYIDTKGRYSTRISNVCFRYLGSKNVWNHNLWPAGKIEDSHRFWAWKLDMIPVEFVVRFQPYGSYLARYPNRDRVRY
jgi:phosphoribosylaminoimidazole-succinocarboxamide synthase